jgi:hypothetical protein
MSAEKKIRHVIVHPYAEAPESMRKAWNARQGKADTIVYDRSRGGTRALDSAHFLDDWEKTPTGSVVAVSGQTAGFGACIMRVLETFAKHPRVRRGMIHIVVEEEATMESSDGALDMVIETVNARHRSSVRKVSRAE